MCSEVCGWMLIIEGAETRVVGAHHYVAEQQRKPRNLPWKNNALMAAGVDNRRQVVYFDIHAKT